MHDAWTPDPKEVNFLSGQGATEREATLAIGFTDGVPPWRIGQLAGYGAGRSRDEDKRRHCWAAAVSRAARRGGSVVPRIQGLIDRLKYFREHGEAPGIANEQEILERLSNVIRTSRDSSVVTAARELLNYHGRGTPKNFAFQDLTVELIRRVGLERARIGFEALNMKPALEILSLIVEGTSGWGIDGRAIRDALEPVRGEAPRGRLKAS